MKFFILLLLLLFVTKLFAQDSVITKSFGDLGVLIEDGQRIMIYGEKNELIFFQSLNEKLKLKTFELSPDGKKILLFSDKGEVSIYSLESKTLTKSNLNLGSNISASAFINDEKILVGTESGSVFELKFLSETDSFAEEGLKIYQAKNEKIHEIKISPDGKRIYFNHSLDTGRPIGFVYSSSLPGDHIGTSGQIGYVIDKTPPSGQKAGLGFKSAEPVFSEEVLKDQQKALEERMKNPRAKKAVFMSLDEAGDYKMLAKIQNYSALDVTDDLTHLFYADRGENSALMYLNLDQLAANAEATKPLPLALGGADFIKIKDNAVVFALADEKKVKKFSFETKKVTEIELPAEPRQIIQKGNSFWIILEDGTMKSLDGRNKRIYSLGTKLTRNIEMTQIGDEFSFIDAKGKRVFLNLSQCEFSFSK